jgi:hypothetical protein
LTDYVLVKESLDFTRLRKIDFLKTSGNLLAELFLDDFVAEINALITDEYATTGD